MFVRVLVMIRKFFLEFCADENNFDELRKLGLAVPKADPPKEIIQKVEVVNPLKDDE